MIPITIVTGKHCVPDENREERTFAEMVAGREREFPLLAKAATNTVWAHAPKIEWIAREQVPGTTAEVWFNYTQIVRTHFTDDADAALTEHLGLVEGILHDGERTENLTVAGKPTRTCGGVRYFLGRDVQHGDRLALRPLRELQLLRNRQAPGKPVCHEWLAEFSLAVFPRDSHPR